MSDYLGVFKKSKVGVYDLKKKKNLKSNLLSTFWNFSMCQVGSDNRNMSQIMHKHAVTC